MGKVRMNRLQEASQDGAAQPTAGDYFVVSADCSTRYVSTDCVYQCSAAQRQAERALLRLLRQERKSDQSYEDED
jgi:hypothetical protein